MLKTESLRIAYGTKIVLFDVSLEVKPGEILALIGPNGAGKTTLVRAVSGTVSKISGSIWVDGDDISKLSVAERARVIAVVPQARQFGGAFTVEQAVMMGRTPYISWLGRESEDDRAVVRFALQQTQLEKFSNRPISHLSGGEQQRVLLARALAQSTPVLLLDEPTNHLDLQHQSNLLTLIKKLAIEKDLAVMMAMHDLNLVSIIADKVALLVDGHLVSVGTPADVIQSEYISEAYRTPVEIFTHPVTGVPIVFPRDVLGP